MRNYLRWSALLTFLWWLVLLPKQFDVFSILTEPIQRPVFALLESIFGKLAFQEDGSGMYLLLFVAPVFGLITALLTLVPAFRKIKIDTLSLLFSAMTFFLILELWEYGWIKLTKMQFYLPEPNTAYTPIGFLSKDIAYWSVIGSSRSYVIFMGVIELLAGALLLFRRTHFFGLFMAAGIFVQVLMVNISFDISVKLYAFLLLAITVLLLSRYPNQWRYLFQLPVKPQVIRKAALSTRKQWARSFVLALIVVEAVYPSVVTGSLNDDTIERPAFHGAYSVIGNPVWKKLFVHRHDYIILEDSNQLQHDWLLLRENKETFYLLNEGTGEQVPMKWILYKNRSLAIVLNETDTLKLKKLPYRNLPLFQDSFHWFSDQYH